MKNKRLISIFTAAAILCSPMSALASGEALKSNRVITNLEFDSMITNAVPFGVNISKAGGFVRQYDEKTENKIFEVNEPAAKSSVDVTLRENSDSMVFSFDYMQSDTFVYTVGSSEAYVNGEAKQMTAPAVIYGSSAMFPALEFENLISGAQISTNEQYGVALIDGNGKNLMLKPIRRMHRSK